MAAALLFAARALAQTSDEAPPDATSWELRTAGTRAALLAAGDADSLEAAALLTHKASAERLQLASLAAAAAPSRPDLAWLALASCIPIESCDVAPFEARLRALDPVNGAAWMGTLTRAAPGTPQSKAGLEGVAASERFDIYWNPLIVHTAQAITRTKSMQAREATVLAIGLGAAQAIPALQPLRRACEDDMFAQQPDARSTCRKLVAALRHGDTFLIEALGTSLALRWWPASSDEQRRAAQERRVLDYRLYTQTSRSLEFTSDEEASRYLELLATHRTEQEVVVAELIAGGISLNPPADWTAPFASPQP